jgi:hypothetical protein
VDNGTPLLNTKNCTKILPIPALPTMLRRPLRRYLTFFTYPKNDTINDGNRVSKRVPQKGPSSPSSPPKNRYARHSCWPVVVWGCQSGMNLDVGHSPWTSVIRFVCVLSLFPLPTFICCERGTISREYAELPCTDIKRR